MYLSSDIGKYLGWCRYHLLQGREIGDRLLGSLFATQVNPQVLEGVLGFC